jgi:hypothetical protein
VPHVQSLADGPHVRCTRPRCLKNDISYDVVPAGKDFDPAGYEKVVSIREDGTVDVSATRGLGPVIVS